jgi:hypothetical protein
LCITVSLCLWLHLLYIFVILLDIQYIYVHLFIISPLSFREKNNLDQQQHMGQEETNKKRDKKIATTTEKRRDPNRHCKHCDVDGHMKEKCWKLHLKLHPKCLNSKRETKEVVEKKEEAIVITSDLDEATFCTTLE